MYTQSYKATSSNSIKISDYPNTNSIITMKELEKRNNEFENKLCENNSALKHKMQDRSTESIVMLLILLLFSESDTYHSNLLTIITLLLMTE